MNSTFQFLSTKIEQDYDRYADWLSRLYDMHKEALNDSFESLKSIASRTRSPNPKLAYRAKRPALSSVDMFVLFLLTRNMAQQESATFLDIGGKYGWSMMTTNLALKNHGHEFTCIEKNTKAKSVLSARKDESRPQTHVLFQDGLALLDQLPPSSVNQIFIDAGHTYSFGKRYTNLNLLNKLARPGQLHFHDFHIDPSYPKEDKKFGESFAIAEWANTDRKTIEDDFVFLYAGRLLTANPTHKRLRRRIVDEDNFFSSNSIPEKYYLHNYFELHENIPLYGSFWLISTGLINC